MASPDFFLSQHPERREPPVHPLIDTAKKVQQALWEKYDRGYFEDIELPNKFQEAAGKLTIKANQGKYMDQPAILSGDSLHKPDLLKDFGSMPATATEEDQLLHHPPSLRGDFKGFSYTMDENGVCHLTAQILAQPDIHTVDGHLSRHAWCYVDDANLEFTQDMYESEVDRTLSIIKKLQPPKRTSETFNHLDTFVRYTTEASPWPLRNHDFLLRLAEQAAILSGDSNFGINTQLSNAALDLFAARLRLPRLLSLQTNRYWQIPPELQTPDKIAPPGHEITEEKEFVLTRPELIFRPRNVRFATLCFAVLQNDTTFHIPLQSITRIDEHER